MATCFVMCHSLLLCLYLGAKQMQPLLSTEAGADFFWSKLRNGKGFFRFWKLQVSAVIGQESPADKFKGMFLSAPQRVLPFPSHISPLPVCSPLWQEGDTDVQLCRAGAQLSPGAGLASPGGKTQHLHTLCYAVRNQYQVVLCLQPCDGTII